MRVTAPARGGPSGVARAPPTAYAAAVLPGTPPTPDQSGRALWIRGSAGPSPFSGGRLRSHLCGYALLILGLLVHGGLATSKRAQPPGLLARDGHEARGKERGRRLAAESRDDAGGQRTSSPRRPGHLGPGNSGSSGSGDTGSSRSSGNPDVAGNPAGPGERIGRC